MLREIKATRRKKSSQTQEQPARPVIQHVSRNFTCNPSDTFASFFHASLPATVRNQTRHDVSLVWFDLHCANDDTIVDTRLTKRALAAAIDGVSLNWFSDRDECFNFLRQRQNTNELVFLVVSGRSSSELLGQSDIISMKSIDSIFIFCLKKQMYEPLLFTRQQIVGTYHDHKTLIQAIHHEIRALSQRDLIVTFHKENGKTGYFVPLEERSKFVWMRLIKESFLRLPRTMEAMNKMRNHFFLMYRRNSVVFQDVKDFIEHYRPKLAINWYTKNKFLYLRINSAMRTENINELLVCQPYIADLCREIKAKSKPISDALTFYRGCVLFNEEIKTYRDNIGFLMGINSFFSASRNLTIAKSFAGCGDFEDNSVRMSVIFEIHVEQGSSSVFTDISMLSDNPVEEEVLFEWNSIFRIRNVNYHDSIKCWIIDLIADHAVQLENEQLYQQLYDTSLHYNPLGAILAGLIHTGEFRQAHDYSTVLLSESPSNLDFLIYHGLACYFECNYNQAIKSLKRALAMTDRDASVTNYIYIMAILLVISMILSTLGERKLAKKYMHNFLDYTNEIFRFLGIILLNNRSLSEALTGDNQVQSSKYCVEVCAQCTGIDRYLSLPVALIDYAFNLLWNGNYDECLVQLEKAELEAIRFITSYSSIRFRLQILFASVYLHQHRLKEASKHLDIAYHIAANNKSRSSPSTRASYYIVKALICILDNRIQEGLDKCLLRARAAYLEADHFVDVPNITLALWNIYHAHIRCTNTLTNISNRLPLEKLMDECFNLCEYDKILNGKSQDNVYRYLLDYAQQIKQTASNWTDHKRSINCETHDDSTMITRL